MLSSGKTQIEMIYFFLKKVIFDMTPESKQSDPDHTLSKLSQCLA